MNGAPHRHHLAHRFHLRGEAVVGGGEFFKRKTRDFGHHIINARLKRSRGAPAGDVVLQFIERVAHRQFGRHFGNRKAGGFGGQRRRAAHARVHFNHNHLAVGRIHRKLHIRAAGVDTDFTQHRQAGIAHDLVFFVGERLRGGNRDGIARVHAHRVEIFNRTNDDAVVVAVTHHFHFILFPAQHRLLNQQFMRGRRIETALANRQKFVFIISNAATRAAHGERRANQRGKAHFGLRRQRLFHGVAHKRLRRVQADFGHRLFKAAAVFGFINRIFRGANQLHIVFRQHAVFGQIQRAIERRLPAHGGQNGIGALFGDNLFHRLPHNRLDIGDIGHIGVGHNRGRIGIDEDDFIALFAQSLTGLRAGIVEFTGLADNNRAGADDEDGF